MLGTRGLRDASGGSAGWPPIARGGRAPKANEAAAEAVRISVVPSRRGPPASTPSASSATARRRWARGGGSASQASSTAAIASVTAARKGSAWTITGRTSTQACRAASAA